MKFLEKFLSDETIKELNTKLGDDLVGQINAKLGDYSIDIGKEKLIPKVVFDADKKALKDQLAERDSQLKELKEKAKDNADLTAKIAELETANKNSKTAYEKSLMETKQTYAYETALAGVKAKNVKALSGLIDKSKITYEDNGTGGYTVKGLSEQIEALKKSDAYLFEGNNPNTPAPQNPPANNDAVKAAQDAKLNGCFGLPTEGK